MASWTVTGTGADTGSEYVYVVTGPEDGSQSDVWQEACRAHGVKRQTGEVSEFLHPVPVSVLSDDVIDGMPADQWHDAMNLD